MTHHKQQVALAIKQSCYQHPKSNTNILYDPARVKLLTFNGVESFPTYRGYKTLLTFDGPKYRMTGLMRFYHWDTEVLAIDFDNEWVTDHGYSRYSITTQRNISEWLGALDKFLPDLPWNWFDWTMNWRQRHVSHRHSNQDAAVPEIDEELASFRRRVPWVTPESSWTADGRSTTYFFHWRKYDPALAEALWRSKEFLSQDFNRRYFTYDWAPSLLGKPVMPHHWVRRFISKDAERRWRNRERRNGRPCPRT